MFFFRLKSFSLHLIRLFFYWSYFVDFGFFFLGYAEIVFTGEKRYFSCSFTVLIEATN
jgi:hypothetical protein